jgi:hypothetical protein
MRFLLPVGGVVDHRFGILTSPAHMGVPAGIVEGMVWGADNGVFTGAFDPDTYLDWLNTMRPYATRCLFVLAPDVVGDARATLERYEQWASEIRRRGFPVGFAAQDGQEGYQLPEAFDALFIGGTTAWKVGPGARDLIERARRLGKHVHIGRINNWRRYEYFRGLPGSEAFTCDGTKTRFIGTERTMALWGEYQERPYSLRLPIPDGRRPG